MLQQRRHDKIMVDAIEGLGIVGEQDKIVLILLNMVIITFVDIAEVVGHPPTREKHSLVVPNELLGGVNDG